MPGARGEALALPRERLGHRGSPTGPPSRGPLRSRDEPLTTSSSVHGIRTGCAEPDRSRDPCRRSATKSCTGSTRSPAGTGGSSVVVLRIMRCMFAAWVSPATRSVRPGRRRRVPGRRTRTAAPSHAGVRAFMRRRFPGRRARRQPRPSERLPPTLHSSDRDAVAGLHDGRFGEWPARIDMAATKCASRESKPTPCRPCAADERHRASA